MAADKSILLDTTSPSTRRRLYRAIRALPAGTYAVDLKQSKPTASALQRGYYWGYIVVEVGKVLGLSRELTDRVLCSKFLSEWVDIASETIQVVRSTSDLDGFGAADFYADVRARMLSTFRVKLSEPNPLLRKSTRAVNAQMPNSQESVTFKYTSSV